MGIRGALFWDRLLLARLDSLTRPVVEHLGTPAPSIRVRISCEIDLCRLHDSLAHARPQYELNCLPIRLAAKRNSCLRTPAPSSLTAPVVSKTTAAYFRCFWVAA